MTVHDACIRNWIVKLLLRQPYSLLALPKAASFDTGIVTGLRTRCSEGLGKAWTSYGQRSLKSKILGKVWARPRHAWASLGKAKAGTGHGLGGILQETNKCRLLFLFGEMTSHWLQLGGAQAVGQLISIPLAQDRILLPDNFRLPCICMCIRKLFAHPTVVQCQDRVTKTPQLVQLFTGTRPVIASKSRFMYVAWLQKSHYTLEAFSDASQVHDI